MICWLIFECVAHRKTPILPLIPAASHPGLLPDSKQSVSTTLAAFHRLVNVEMSEFVTRTGALPGRSLGLNQSSITMASVHDPKASIDQSLKTTRFVMQGKVIQWVVAYISFGGVYGA